MHETATMPYRRHSLSRPRWPRPDRTSDDRPRLARGCRGTRVKSIAGSRGQSRACDSLTAFIVACLPYHACYRPTSSKTPATRGTRRWPDHIVGTGDASAHLLTANPVSNRQTDGLEVAVRSTKANGAGSPFGWELMRSGRQRIPH